MYKKIAKLETFILRANQNGSLQKIYKYKYK
jgi:hypothetical protein